MLFNSPQFAIFFPVVVLGFYGLPSRLRWAWLLAASLVFYSAYGEPLFVVLMLAQHPRDTGRWRWPSAARAARRRGGRSSPSHRRGPQPRAAALRVQVRALPARERAGRCWGPAAGQLLPTSPRSSLLLPAGITFYTFQTLSYVIDVYPRTPPRPSAIR